MVFIIIMIKLVFCIFLAAFSTYATIYFFSHSGAFDLIGVYTLISGILAFLLPCLSFLNCYFQQKRKGYWKCDSFQQCLIHFILLWSFFSLVVFFSQAHVFPSASSYGGFTIFYMIVFSLPIFGLLIALLFSLKNKNAVYKVIIISFMLPLIAITLALFLGTAYQKYSFFSYNMLTAVVATFIALTMGVLVNRYWGSIIETREQIILIILYEAVGAIGFPLLAVSVLFNFILLMLKENLFADESTYTFACLAISSTYLLTIAGLVGQLIHNMSDLVALSFSNTDIRAQVLVFSLFPLCQAVIQNTTLIAYFLFS